MKRSAETREHGSKMQPPQFPLSLLSLSSTKEEVEIMEQGAAGSGAGAAGASTVKVYKKGEYKLSQHLVIAEILFKQLCQVPKTAQIIHWEVKYFLSQKDNKTDGFISIHFGTQFNKQSAVNIHVLTVALSAGNKFNFKMGKIGGAVIPKRGGLVNDIGQLTFLHEFFEKEAARFNVYDIIMFIIECIQDSEREYSIHPGRPQKTHFLPNYYGGNVANILRHRKTYHLE